MFDLRVVPCLVGVDHETLSGDLGDPELERAIDGVGIQGCLAVKPELVHRARGVGIDRELDDFRWMPADIRSDGLLGGHTGDRRQPCDQIVDRGPIDRHRLAVTRIGGDFTDVVGEHDPGITRGRKLPGLDAVLPRVPLLRRWLERDRDTGRRRRRVPLIKERPDRPTR